jgi:hypothetical protein
VAGRDRVGRPVAHRRVAGDEKAIYAARARRLGLPFSPVVRFGGEGAVGVDAAAVRNGRFAMSAGGERHVFVAPDADALAQMGRWLSAYPSARDRLNVATPTAIRAALIEAGACQFRDAAINRLSRLFPEYSARQVTTPAQIVAGLAVLATIGAGVYLDSPATFFVLNIVAGLLFFGVTTLRFIAALSIGSPGHDRRRRASLPVPDERLPVYTVLVPLYREERVVGDLLAALDRIDWPADRLDVKLIVEADDWATRKAVEAVAGAPYEVVVVPPAEPRTKPKALAFALPFARGRYVTVYDAEDRPHPGQLREAFATFQRAGPDLGCLQAPIVIDNGQTSALARLFAVEYSALFDGLLPALARLGMPFPLGGTSNHFRGLR